MRKHNQQRFFSIRLNQGFDVKINNLSKCQFYLSLCRLFITMYESGFENAMYEALSKSKMFINKKKTCQKDLLFLFFTYEISFVFVKEDWSFIKCKLHLLQKIIASSSEKEDLRSFLWPNFREFR